MQQRSDYEVGGLDANIQVQYETCTYDVRRRTVYTIDSAKNSRAER